MSRTFSSLAIRNYRIYFFGALVSNTGTWMGRVAQDWLVLTHLTDHSASALGIVTALQWSPFLLFAPITGVLADRWPKRTILLVTQSLIAACLLLSAALVLTGIVQLWHIMVLAFVQGCVTALDNPSRQAFVSEMVGQEHVTNAVGLNSASFNLGRLIGPGLAGLIIAAIDVGPALLINGLSFVCVLIALVSMDPRQLHPAPLVTGKGRLREGVRYVRHRPDIMMIMLLVFVLGTFGMNFQITTALMATREFGKGPTEYGILGSIMAIGSLTAALLTARRQRPRLRILLAALAGFVVATFGLATAPSYLFFGLWLVPVGLSAMTAMTTANAMVQLTTDAAMRGRVMGLYMWIFIGGTPFGSPIIGRIADDYGPRWSILVGTVAVSLALVGVAAYLVRHENVRVRIERSPWQVHVTRAYAQAQGELAAEATTEVAR